MVGGWIYPTTCGRERILTAVESAIRARFVRDSFHSLNTGLSLHFPSYWDQLAGTRDADPARGGHAGGRAFPAELSQGSGPRCSEGAAGRATGVRNGRAASGLSRADKPTLTSEIARATVLSSGLAAKLFDRLSAICRRWRKHVSWRWRDARAGLGRCRADGRNLNTLRDLLSTISASFAAPAAE